MKTIIMSMVFIFVNIVLSQSQSSIVFDNGTTIEVTGSADICADVITINGSYLGSGTQCNAPLPVELISFNITVEQNNVLLKWQTATEVNNYGFEIEKYVVNRQVAVSRWEQIGFIEGHGNSNSPKEYAYADKNISDGKYYYRLKQIDTDGNFGYSEILGTDIKILPSKYALFQNYPNPFNPSTTIEFSLTDDSNVRLNLYSLTGELITELISGAELTKGTYKFTFDASKLASGTYIYSLEANGKKLSKKLTLIK